MSSIHKFEFALLLSPFCQSVPKVQAVVYTTCSVFSEENENVVTKVMDYTNERMTGKTHFRMIPPVIPLTPRDLETQKSSKYLTIEPSEVMGGCFVAVLSREVGRVWGVDINRMGVLSLEAGYGDVISLIL